MSPQETAQRPPQNKKKTNKQTFKTNSHKDIAKTQHETKQTHDIGFHIVMWKQFHGLRPSQNIPY